MSASLGRLCLVLHGHLPYVLHHGVWPHGESWLYEAAAETYLPLLELLDELASKQLRCGLTIGLTPVLLEQLAHPHFKEGFQIYLQERMKLARLDAAGFKRRSERDLLRVAQHWEKWYAERVDYFAKIGRDIPARFSSHFRDGQIEILTSAITHAYLPLLCEESSIRAQLSAGVRISDKYFHRRSTGLWLPECAYRPATQQWLAPVLHCEPQDRPGLEDQIAAQSLSHFFVDTHLISLGKPLAIMDSAGTRPTSDALIFWDTKRGWGIPLDPVGVASAASEDKPRTFAFARHPRVSEQVWSAMIGYPGADAYLEFHRKHGENGLRYHRITSHHTPTLEKLPYDSQLVAGKSYEQAQHFCGVLREVLTDYTKQTGRVGTIVASFDAELFGHWWFEGFDFLRNVMLTLAHDKTIDVVTSESALASSDLDKVMHLPEGSWGEGGHHHVWLNEQTRWLWETEYRAEIRFGKLLKELPWRKVPAVREMLERAGRELLLLQASDWPFAIHSGAAGDYGISRFSGHASRFDRLATISASLASGQQITPVQQTEIAEATAHDVILEEIDLEWWSE